MERTTQLISDINAMVANVAAVAGKCDWLIIAPKELRGMALGDFLGLCEHFDQEPDVRGYSFGTSFRVNGVTISTESENVPELRDRQKSSMRDLIKVILAERSKQAAA